MGSSGIKDKNDIKDIKDKKDKKDKNDNGENNNNKVTEKKQKEEASSQNRVSNVTPMNKSQVVNENKISSTKKSTAKEKESKVENGISKGVDLRKLVKDVEEQKQILNEHQKILNQLLDFYKSTKNK